MNRKPPRDDDPARWLYGRHAVEAALANPARRCRRLLALREIEAEAKALLAGARAAQRPNSVELLDRRALEKLLPLDAVHQGLALMAEKLPGQDLDAILKDTGESGRQIVVVLDQVTDPHNVGAILRSAAAFGALAVVTTERGAPPVTGALAKAASGALEAVPFLHVANLARALELLKKAGFWTLGLDDEAKDVLGALDLPPRMALVLGAEGPGMRRLTREHCDFLARLPTRDAMPSLNVSNAAAVALYALSQLPSESR